MKNLLLGAMMLTGVVTFAQETPKKPVPVKDATQTTTTTTVDANKSSEVSKTTAVKQDANGDKQVETATTTKTATPAQPTTVAPAKQKPTKKQ